MSTNFVNQPGVWFMGTLHLSPDKNYESTKNRGNGHFVLVLDANCKLFRFDCRFFLSKCYMCFNV